MPCELNADLRTLISQCVNEVILTEIAQIPLGHDSTRLQHPQPLTASPPITKDSGGDSVSHSVPLGTRHSFKAPQLTPQYHTYTWAYSSVGTSQPRILPEPTRILKLLSSHSQCFMFHHDSGMGEGAWSDPRWKRQVWWCMYHWLSLEETPASRLSPRDSLFPEAPQLSC